MKLPLEALDDDLLDVHLCRKLPPEGQLKPFEGESERVASPADFRAEILRYRDVATMPPRRCLRKGQISCRRERVLC
jgi:hypothetical protein